ncbi:MAG: FtsW/RodA/SpoVE family cell cycle protein [Aquificae bacterium]|nr:FtsW/RodA/SpoVE family cell cycle protein [Aquificota bacterium]
MLRNRYIDGWLVLSFLLLVGLGAVFILSAASSGGFINNPYKKNELINIFIREPIILTVGFFTALVSYLLPVSFWKRIAYPLAGVVILLLVVVLVVSWGTGKSVARWINLGFINFQPSELAKLSVILYLAYLLSIKEKKRDFAFFKDYKGVLVAVSIPLIMAILVFIEPHKGAAAFILLLTFFILAVSKIQFRKLVIVYLGIVLSALLLLIAYKGIDGFLKSYFVKRIVILINPTKHRDEGGFQIEQARNSFIRGGLIGVGIGNSMQKKTYVPEIHTDFIFALIAEETGFLGASLVFFLFVVIFYRGMVITFRLRETFDKLLAVGITLFFSLQAILHMAINLLLFPPTGITLPFISYGGSSFIVSSICAGILLRLSKEMRIKSLQEVL